MARSVILGISAALGIGLFVVGVLVGHSTLPGTTQVLDVINPKGDPLTAAVGAEPVDFQPYWRVWNTLERKFVPHGTSTIAAVSDQDKMYRSIEGLVASYHDPYTIFMRPQASEDFKIATKGSLEGIGAVIGEQGNGIVVVGPLPNSPAAHAGLVPGDRILAVDDTPTDGNTVDDAVSRIRGQGGTAVVLSIQSKGQEPRNVSITRGTIEIPSTVHAVVEREVPKVAQKPAVPLATATSGLPAAVAAAVPRPSQPVETEIRNFYLIRLFSFSQTSVNAFERELYAFKESGVNSLIIDLRGNPGGYLEAAVDIAGWFLPKDSVVVRERIGPTQKVVEHKTTHEPLFTDDMPHVVVLVDKATASAAEILAAALKEYGVATVVGTHTFGKGSVQELVNITDDLSLKVTVARWYTPHDLSISDGGLAPNVAINTNATSSDPWVDAAIEFITTGTTTTASVR